MYAARKSGLKKEMFGYVSGGYEKVNSRFVEYLVNAGVEIKYNSKVSSVVKTSSGFLEVTSGNTPELYNNVISTLPSKLSASLAPQLSEEEKKKLNEIKYLGVICPSIMLKKAISSYYVTNITDTVAPFTGVIEMTALIDKKEVNGKHLVYLPKYINSDDSLFAADDEELRMLFIGSLLKMYPSISNEEIIFWGVSKARNVFALPTIEYSQKVPDVITSISNFYIVNSAQIINGTLNVNETIQVAEKKLNEILNKNEEGKKIS
jgi:protoporphyrinogen oxidase